ncbi:MAG: TonB-dependent receptor [Flavobacteriales bacterium]|nr:MAG: TonB-dependent receptor [Flavobacteriales bacterium]
MKNFKNVLVLALFLVGATLMAQSTLTGVVVDENDIPLPGADVTVKGTTRGTVTDFDGNFTLECKMRSGEIVVSYMGYEQKTFPFQGAKRFGTIKLMPSASTLDEVVIVGVADIAKDRETPVAISTIKAAQIIERLGSQELPELLNATPSVYATKSGGGFGDAKISVRGFDQRNTAVMINGMPVNDMENGKVYWSNWAGLSDVTSAMQVQRGLGSSKLAISSVGGTINVLTRSSQKKQGGSLSTMVGNDNYLKTVLSYNTGKMDSGFSSSILLSRTAGDGYVDGTNFEGYNYYLAFGLDKEFHNFQLTLTGAPQVHNQRTSSYYNMATLGDYLKYGTRYNYNHGYLNGEEFNWRRNFYHKPIASLNWDWQISASSKLNSVFYASFGRGGGTGDIGVGPYYGYASSKRYRNMEGLVDWDKLVQYNSGEEVEFYDGYTYQIEPNENGEYIMSSYGNGLVRRASMNSHNWIGLISNFNHEINDNLTFDVGVDLRTYKGIHYRRLDNLLGADGFYDNKNINNPDNVLYNTYSSDLASLWNVFKSIKDEEKIAYYNDGLVNWYGVFGQFEYKNENVSMFIQASGSNKGYQRVDYFKYEDSDPAQTSDWVYMMGGNIKGGLNYNLNEKHNVFANAGYYLRQPNMDAVFLNYANDINEERENEKVLGMEIGYGYRGEKASLNLNLYRTSWKDRFTRISYSGDNNEEGTANMFGVQQVHYGAELDAYYRPLDNLRIKAMVSLGDWEYAGDVQGKAYDENQNYLADVELKLDGVKVWDVAQFTSRLALEWDIAKGFSFDIDQFYADKLYSGLATEDDWEGYDKSLKLPAYSLVNTGLSYKFKIAKTVGVNLRLNVNNLFNKEYIAESATNYQVEEGDRTYKGISARNKVFFGFGRTWNASVRFNF